MTLVASSTLAVRTRRTLARPAVRRFAVAMLAAVTAVLVLGLVGGAESARARWGRTRPVVVATHDLAPGDILGPAAVATRHLPAAIVPGAALGAVPAGAVVRQPIVAGEAVVPARLAPLGLTGVAALVSPGRRAVAVPRGPAGTPPLAVGDAVDVVAVPGGTGGGLGGGGLGGGGPGGDRLGAGGYTLVEGATVVNVADRAVTVAVPEADAPRVAGAITTGAVVLALAGR